MIDSSSRDHHDSNNGQEPALDYDEVMVQSGVTGDGGVQHSGGRKDASNENQGFTLQKIPMNFPLSAGFLKQLTVSNFYRRQGAEGGGRTACMVSYTLGNDPCCDGLNLKAHVITKFIFTATAEAVDLRRLLEEHSESHLDVLL